MFKSNNRAIKSAIFSVLSENQVEDIHHATLDVLQRTGVRVYEEESRELLYSAGAKIDGNLVRIPPHLVERAINSAPSRIVVSGRDGCNRIVLEGTNSNFGPGPTTPETIDLETGIIRKTTKQDAANSAKLCDALPNIDYAMSLSLVSDRTDLLADLHEFHAMLINTTKPLTVWGFDVPSIARMVQIGALIKGSKQELKADPFFIVYAEPSSPLMHSEKALKKLLYVAEQGIPLVYTPCAMAGATAASTMAGLLVTANSESISGLVIHQLKNPGAPFIMGGVVSVIDMSTTIFSYGAPEMSLLSAAYTQIAHYYKIPMFSTAGCSDSHVLDQQAGIEAAISCMMAALSGANLIHDVGYLASGLIGSHHQLVMCDEIIGMVKRILSDVKVNEDTLACDVIDRVGPGGNFIIDDHTLMNFKREYWMPTLLNRFRYTEWCRDSKKSMGDRIKEKTLGLLSSHEVTPIKEKIAVDIEKIVNEAEQEIINRR